MTEEELQILSNEELQIISSRKNSKGVATSDALKAQKVLWQRAGEPLTGPVIPGSFNNNMFPDDDYGFGNKVTDLYDDFIDEQNDSEPRHL